MCGSSPKTPPPPPPAVPLPIETSKPAAVELATDKQLRRPGRRGLSVPGASGSTATGMSGLNIPQ
jgi:hypothetical protein